MSINLSEVILTVVNFIVLMLLLNQFLYKPVVKFMDERKARIQAGLDAQAEAEQALENCQQSLQAELTETHQQSKQLESSIWREAHGKCDALLEDAAKRAQAQKQDVAAQMLHEEQVQYAALHAQLPQLVEALAGHLLQDEAAAQRNAAEITACVEAAGQTV